LKNFKKSSSINRIIYFVIIVSIILSTITINATAENEVVKFSIDSVSSNVGSTVTVPIRISGVPSSGINNFDLSLWYDMYAFDIVNITKGDSIKDSSSLESVDNANTGTVKFLFADSTQGNNPITSNGVIAIITFKINPETLSGNYKIKIDSIGSCSALVNKTSVPLNAEKTGGIISIIGSTATPLDSVTPTPTPTGESVLTTQIPEVTHNQVIPTPIRSSATKESSSTPRATSVAKVEPTPIVLVSEEMGNMPKGIPAELVANIKTEKNIYKEDEIIKFSIRYLNRLDKPASNVVISAGILDNTTVIESSITSGGILKGKNVEWTISNLEVGKTGNLEFEVKVGALPSSIIESSQSVTINSSTNVSKDNMSSSRLLLIKNDATFEHKKYVGGYKGGLIKPDNEVTRAEVAVMFSNILGLPLVDSKVQTYKDVKVGNWASKYINAVSKAGLFKGYGKGKQMVFKPNDKITRAELATAIARYLDLKDIMPLEVHFSDITKHWGLKSIEEVYRLNLVSGYGKGLFKPNNKIKRAEVMVMLNRMTYRGPLNEAVNPFKDLKSKHWALNHILESTVDHTSYRPTSEYEVVNGK